MLSAQCFFRGNYMTVQGAQMLLDNMCAIPELIPDSWGTFEPIDKPFNPRALGAVIHGSMVPSERAKKNFAATTALFLRSHAPRLLISMALRLAPVQWTSAHNVISINAEEPSFGGEAVLANYLLSGVLPEFPDYAKIVESSQEDPERLREFRRPMTGREVVESFRTRLVVLPFGPYGCLEDIYWFNYFGKTYVEFIGRERLLSAGWARVEEVDEGLACYASLAIDAPNARELRSKIAFRLEEFVWTPGCEGKDKRIPAFDFSAQEQALRNK
jgi:hypothetical protein